MWVLFIVSTVSEIAERIVYRPLSKVKHTRQETLKHMIAWCAFITQLSPSNQSHWWVVTGSSESNTLKWCSSYPWLSSLRRSVTSKLNSRKYLVAVWTLNGLFAAVIFIYSFLCLFYFVGIWDGENTSNWIHRVGIVMYLSPTVLLLAAVIKVRCMVSQLRNKAIFQKEKIIILHTVLFSLYIGLLAVARIAIIVQNSTEEI